MPDEDVAASTLTISLSKSEETGLWNITIVIAGFRDRDEALLAADAVEEVLVREFDMGERSPPDDLH